MPAAMNISQVGLPAATPGESRTDGLRTGALVTLESTTVGTTYKFQFLWIPARDQTAVGTLAETAPGAATWTFTPDTDRPGTYRIQLIVDEGLPTESSTIRTFGVRTESGLLIPAFNERADEDASLILNTATEIEASENNESSPFTSINWQGWFDFYQDVASIRHIEQGFKEQAGVAAVIVAAWYLKAGYIVAGSRVIMGADTGIHNVTATLREHANPGPVVASWTTTSGVQDVPHATSLPITIPNDGWYTLEIVSANVAAIAILQGVHMNIRYERP